MLGDLGEARLLHGKDAAERAEPDEAVEADEAVDVPCVEAGGAAPDVVPPAHGAEPGAAEGHRGAARLRLFTRPGRPVASGSVAPSTADLSLVERVAPRDRHLAVVTTLRADATMQASVVNAGPLDHPVSHERVVAFVTYGRQKLANLRARPQVTVVFRASWEWVAVEGKAELAGPDDELAGLAPDAVPALLRSVFQAAGGTHEDWETFDRVMRDERRTAVLVRPERAYSNRT